MPLQVSEIMKVVQNMQFYNHREAENKIAVWQAFHCAVLLFLTKEARSLVTSSLN